MFMVLDMFQERIKELLVLRLVVRFALVPVVMIWSLIVITWHVLHYCVAVRGADNNTTEFL